MVSGFSSRVQSDRLAGGKYSLGLEHLRTSQLKLLLRAADLSIDGSREDLLNRLREEVVLDVEHEWVVNKLHTETPIREDATVVERFGDLYMFGGKDENSDIGSQEVLMLPKNSGSWVALENHGTWPERRYAHCAVVYDSKMYIWGGQRDCNSERYFNDMHCFDFKTHAWHEVLQNGSVPCPRSYAKAVVWGKHMLMYGGVDTDHGGDGGLTEFSEGAGTVMQFDFETNTWSQQKAHGPPGTKPLPILIEALAVYNAHLYAILYDYRKPGMDLQVYQLDLDKMKWHKVKTKGLAPSPRTRFAHVALGRQWIIQGGLQQAAVEDDSEEPEAEPNYNQPSDETYTYSFESDTWTQIEFVGRAPVARGGHAACELLGSMVLVGGHVPKDEEEEEEADDEEELFSGADSDGEEAGSDIDSNDGYSVGSLDLEALDDQGQGQGGHAPEHSGNDYADSVSSQGEVVSLSYGQSGSAGSLQNDSDGLKTVEVLQPRPTGPAADRLCNVDLCAHLKRFCCDENHSDVTLVVENKRFPAHKLVLAAQSETFDAMFHGGMREQITGEVEIGDMRPEVMKSFLSYLYGCLPSIRASQAMELFRASDRYGVISLRTECLQLLQLAIDHQNAAAIAQLADEHSCEELMNACTRFAANVQDLPKVVGSPAFMELMRSKPELAQRFLTRATEIQAETGRSTDGGGHRRRKKRRRHA